MPIPLLAGLRKIVGKQHVLTGDSATRRYRTGFRFGLFLAINWLGTSRIPALFGLKTRFRYNCSIS